MKNTRYSIYTTLGLIVVSVVACAVFIGSLMAYYSAQDELVENIKVESKFIAGSLQRNLAHYLEAYAVNEYEQRIAQEMHNINVFAILVQDKKMGEILGDSSHVTGKIRDDSWKVIDYDPENAQQRLQIEQCFYSTTYDITSALGAKIGEVSVCSSDQAVNAGLMQTIIKNGMSATLYTILIVSALFFSIRQFILKPISSMASQLLTFGRHTVPLNRIREEGPKEIASLAESVNFMADVVHSHERDSKNALLATITAVAKALEVRDPYTAGHQQHVAFIATQIATQMGLDTQCIEGIRLGAIIHDIGKLSVPVELLVKPTKLSKLELELIKTHTIEGGQILKGVDFPWPILEIIEQHHERLDGSGYPYGLKRHQICLEAKIIGVADVFEAMSAHRPYRPALGADLALKELMEHSGTLYDEAVVDALIKLLEEDKNRFNF